MLAFMPVMLLLVFIDGHLGSFSSVGQHGGLSVLQSRGSGFESRPSTPCVEFACPPFHPVLGWRFCRYCSFLATSTKWTTAVRSGLEHTVNSQNVHIIDVHFKNY